MTQEIERLVEPIAQTLAFARGWTAPSDEDRDAARAVLQSDALTALIKREGERDEIVEKLAALRRMCAACSQPLYIEILDEVLASLGRTLVKNVDEHLAALNPNTESE